MCPHIWYANSSIHLHENIHFEKKNITKRFLTGLPEYMHLFLNIHTENAIKIWIYIFRLHQLHTENLIACYLAAKFM